MTPPIRIYIHCAMMYDWEDVIQEMFNSICDSGVYDACESISIAALGSVDEYKKLMDLTAKYDKRKLVKHNEDLSITEVITLNHLKKDADTNNRFIAVYLHTKGVSHNRQTHSDNRKWGDYWRRYMLHFIVNNWQENLPAFNMLDMGYDLVGVRVIPARRNGEGLTHISGNFWMADSEYIRTLEKINFNLRGGLYAEMWVCSKSPLIYIACNAYTVGFPFHEDFNTEIKKLDITKYKI